MYIHILLCECVQVCVCVCDIHNGIELGIVMLLSRNKSSLYWIMFVISWMFAMWLYDLNIFKSHFNLPQKM